MGVLLKCFQKQLKVTARGGVDCDSSCLLVREAILLNNLFLFCFSSIWLMSKSKQKMFLIIF